MKKLISTFVAAVLVTASLAAQESFTTKFGSIKGVTSVYVSKALLSMMPDMKSNGMNFAAVASKLDNIQILNTETKAAANALNKGCRQIIVKEKYENLMNVSDGGEHTGIYMKEYARGKKQYIMLNIDEDETSVIVLTGDLTLQDIKNVIGK